MERWTREFSRLCTQEIQVPPPFGPPLATSSPQLRKFIEDKIDFAFLTRDMSEADLETYRKFHRSDPFVIPVAGGSYRHFGFVDTVGIIVNRRNPVKSLSLAQIGSIFFEPVSGHHKPGNWDEIGGWSGRHPIHIVGSTAWRPTESARAEFLRRKLAESGVDTGNWRTDMPVTGGEADVPAQVAADPDAIGFTGLGHLLPGDKLIAVSTHRAGKAVRPTYGNVALGLYPFARTIDLILSVPMTGRIDPRLCSFADFLLSRPGQTIVRDEKVFLPLRHAQLFRSRALLAPHCKP